MWTFLAVGYHPTKSKAGAYELHHELNKGLEDVGSVVLFLLPAMGVVESIDHFGGFAVVTYSIRRITRGRKDWLMPTISLLTFFLSSVIDNLTATIVALKILRHVVHGDQDFRRTCGGLAVIAANAGGAWSPIGDVTTTMLWIQGKITGKSTVLWLFLPSLVAGIMPLLGIWWQYRRQQSRQGVKSPTGAQTKPRSLALTAAARHSRASSGALAGEQEEDPLRPEDDEEVLGDEVTFPKVMALVLGITCILMVPALKMLTGLPPYLGMLLALAVMWLATDTLIATTGESDDQGNVEEVMHSGPPVGGVVAALRKVDLTGLLFFTGVLLAVGALDSAKVLKSYAEQLKAITGDSPVSLCILLGLSSALVDNVPLVEASIDMYRKTPADHPLWQLVALAAGTGGSILSIGSIAGVTLMSMEGVSFIWFCQRLSFWACMGFSMGIATYQAERLLLA